MLDYTNNDIQQTTYISKIQIILQRSLQILPRFIEEIIALNTYMSMLFPLPDQIVGCLDFFFIHVIEAIKVLLPGASFITSKLFQYDLHTTESFKLLLFPRRLDDSPCSGQEHQRG